MKTQYFIPALMIFAISCSGSGEEKAGTTSGLGTVKLDSYTDPVCQMSVKEEIKDTALYQGKVYGFCNEGCKKEFVKKPGDYLKD